uniref:MULE transposase domain-containing protein n=1 Tax=Lactuca sativa TaxID=4236 RepID=A0A9R1VGR4_LACSA|nr:hypothetical protein LSAT_V11C500284820 [Lactuca sativa]
MRQMSYSEKEFIVHASTSKIGPTMAHKLRTSLRGGYEFIKPKVVDYKNLRRDINRVIGYKVAQMIVNTMNDRQAHCPNYSFEFNYKDNVLDYMFWANEIEKAYYAKFGDVISFDATFQTNNNEIIESYSWLLKSFLKTHGKEPTLVLTDQDAAIKQAIENVFPNSKHRLCMWHIMKKLKSKEFNLEDMRWFKDMFTKRDSWILGYFNDIAMCGLMKTTSRSESMNSFFNTYSESDNLLLNFMMNYDTAIQKQRNTQRELDNTSKKTSYKMQTPREIELQASKVEIKAEDKEINCNCQHFKRDCENVKLVNDSYYNFESCLDIIRDDKKKLALFVEKKQMLLKEFKSESDYTSAGLKSNTDGEVVCKLMGVSIPNPKEINIHVPQVQSNKGSGIKKRIPSASEVVYENSKKEHRMCSGCEKRVPHNLRTCLVRIVAAQSTKDI